MNRERRRSGRQQPPQHGRVEPPHEGLDDDAGKGHVQHHIRQTLDRPRVQQLQPPAHKAHPNEQKQHQHLLANGPKTLRHLSPILLPYPGSASPGALRETARGRAGQRRAPGEKSMGSILHDIGWLFKENGRKNAISSPRKGGKTRKNARVFACFSPSAQNGPRTEPVREPF